MVWRCPGPSCRRAPAQPFYSGARAFGAPSAASSSARSCPMSTSGEARVSPRTLPQGLGAGRCSSFSRGVWRRADRSVLRIVKAEEMARHGSVGLTPLEQPHDRLAPIAALGRNMKRKVLPRSWPARRSARLPSPSHRALGRCQPQDHARREGTITWSTAPRVHHLGMRATTTP